MTSFSHSLIGVVEGITRCRAISRSGQSKNAQNSGFTQREFKLNSDLSFMIELAQKLFRYKPGQAVFIRNGLSQGGRR